jgi:hypothetical protein
MLLIDNSQRARAPSSGTERELALSAIGIKPVRERAFFFINLQRDDD